jgi:hypothetical protein
MPITAPVGGSKSEPISAGAHHAICYGVVSIGTQPTQSKEYAPKKKVVILWELPNERADFGEKKDQARSTSRRYTLSMNPKASLRKDLENWRGRPFTDTEAAKFDISSLIGANCFINCVHEDRAGTVYANVASIMPLPKGMPKKTNENPPMYFSVEEAIENAMITLTPDIEFPSNLPGWLQERVKACGEYISYCGEKNTPKAPAPAAPKATQASLGEDTPF